MDNLLTTIVLLKDAGIVGCICYILYIALQWHITNVIDRNTDLSDDKVRSLTSMTKRPRVKN